MTMFMPELVLLGVVTPTASLDVQFQAPLAELEAAQPKIDEIMSDFAWAGWQGAFASPNVSPDRSSLKAQASVRRSQYLHAQLQAENVDVRAYQVVRNMISRLQMDDIGISRITVRDVCEDDLNRAVVPPPDEENEDDVYASASSQLGFELDFEEMPRDKTRRSLVEFGRPLEPQHILELSTRVGAWFNVIELGGWATPIGHPAELHSMRGGVCQFDEVTAEISVFCFRCSEQAWNSLINILGAYSLAVLPVTKVTIE